jgi:hypothetical protein
VSVPVLSFRVISSPVPVTGTAIPVLSLGVITGSLRVITGLGPVTHVFEQSGTTI